MSNFHANSTRHFTVEVEDEGGALKKRKYRSRAHANPLADPQFEYPVSPECVDWNVLYPKFCEDGAMKRRVDFADVGCGFGGLLVQLGENFPEKISVGIEIREKVASYVDQRIKALRTENKDEKFQNIAIIRTNAMKCITNFFSKGSLEKIFFCFPDPHFKTKNHRRRIINKNSISEFAYVLKEGGLLYAITDVKELHEWQVQHLDAHPSFERLKDEEEQADKCFPLIHNSSEEANKVARNEGSKYGAIYRRLSLKDAVAKMG